MQSLPIDLIRQNVVIYKKEGDNFIFVDLNQMTEQTEQVEKSSLVGRKLTELFPGVKEFGLFDVLCRVYESGQSEVHETAFYKDDRIQGWRHNTVYRLDDGTLAVLYEDKSNDKHLEELLTMLGTIVDTSMNEIYIFNADDLRFTYVNGGVCGNLGYTIDEMQQMTPVDIKPEYSMERFRQLLTPLLEGTKKRLLFETLHRRKDGSDYDVEIRLQLIEQEGRKQFVVFADDISSRKAIEKRLLQSEEQFRSIAESTLMGILIYQPNVVYANKAFMELSGYTMQELAEMMIWDFVEPELQEGIKTLVMRRLTGEQFEQQHDDVRFMTKGHGVKIVRLLTRTVPYHDAYAGLVTITDITDITETKQQLNLLARVVEQTDDLIKITDREGTITYVNDALVAHSGYTRKELIGKMPAVFASGEYDHGFYEKMWSTILSGRIFRHTFVNRKKDGHIFYEEETITPIMDERGQVTHFVATGKDITARMEMEQELIKRATIDMLTKIYNREEANHHLGSAIENVQRYKNNIGLLMIDLDHFKQINDEHGHDAGDEVLQAFSRLISMHVRESDIFARWGGEEFVLITSYADEEALRGFAEKLRTVVKTFKFPHIGSLSISIGLTTIRPDDTRRSLLKRAYDALYSSKAEGCDRVGYAPL